MKITYSHKRNLPDTLTGESITVTITYSSFCKEEIDNFEKSLSRGIVVMDTESTGGDKHE